MPTFIWPGVLWGLLLLPVVVAGYVRAHRRIYRQLARRIAWERRPTEVSAAVAGAAAVFLVAAPVLAWTVHPLRP